MPPLEPLLNASQSFIIPNGLERPSIKIGLFDRAQQTRAIERSTSFEGLNFCASPDNASAHVAFLCAPKPLYRTPRYIRAENYVLRETPENARLFLAADTWHSADDWRSSYRNVLKTVTHCYVLCNADDSIGAGAWAELLWLTREGNPLQYLAVLRSSNIDADNDDCVTTGLFKPVPFHAWTWDRAARYHPPRKRRARPSKALALSTVMGGADGSKS
jgi:hypothetical protein